LARAAYAEEEGFEIDTGELQASADQFRYQRGLVTAEETERWLSDRDVGEDDLVAFLERRYWLGRFSAEAQQIKGSYAPNPSTASDVLWPGVVFSSALGPLAIPLARRLAVAAASSSAAPAATPEDIAASRASFFERSGCGPEGLAAWLAGNRCTVEWFDEL